jgi:hypothetical protein
MSTEHQAGQRSRQSWNLEAKDAPVRYARRATEQVLTQWHLRTTPEHDGRPRPVLETPGFRDLTTIGGRGCA